MNFFFSFLFEIKPKKDHIVYRLVGTALLEFFSMIPSQFKIKILALRRMCDTKNNLKVDRVYILINSNHYFFIQVKQNYYAIIIYIMQSASHINNKA